MPILIKIDVTKIEKDRLFVGKNGAKYLDIVLLDSPNDKYGNDYMAIQSVSKEERENGVRGPILGNGKNLGGFTNRATQNKSRRQEENLDEDIPF